MISDLKQKERYYCETFPAFLEFIKSEYSENKALEDDSNPLTYNELYTSVARKVSYINSLNLKSRSHIAVMSYNSIEAMITFLAIPASGNILVMLPVQTSPVQYKNIIEKFDIDAVFLSDEFLSFSKLTDVPAFDICNTSDYETGFAEVTDKTIAAIFLTGGTTGIPKGVVLTHKALLTGAYNSVVHMTHYYGSINIFLHRRYIAMLPLSHVFGAVTGFIFGLLTGSVLLPKKTVSEAIEAIPEFKPTALVLVPSILELIFSISDVKGSRYVDSIEYVSCGATSLDDSLIKKSYEKSVGIIYGYGLTETASTFFTLFEHKTCPGAAGQILPSDDIKIVDGELLLKGDSLFTEYYKEPELTKTSFSDGYFHTGDLAKIEQIEDKQYLVLLGRKKNLIILGNGENVSPEELESIFIKHSEIKDCMVKEMSFNSTNVIGIEILPDFEQFSSENKTEIEKKLREIINLENSQLPTYKQIRKLVIKDSPFERNEVMKKIRRQK